MSRILIVEDEVSFSDPLSYLLRKEGYDVVVAETGPDGLAVDAHDRLYISNPGHGCVWVVDAHGVPLYRIQSAAGRMTTNCAVTPDGRSLVITESHTGSILICEVPSPE